MTDLNSVLDRNNDTVTRRYIRGDIIHDPKSETITQLSEMIDKALPKEKIGTEKIPLNHTERGYNIAIQDFITELNKNRL